MMHVALHYGTCCFALIYVSEDGMQFSSQVMVEFLDLVPIVGNSFEALRGWWILDPLKINLPTIA